MPDAVTCGECGHSYDSDQNAFCPRCGSTGARKADPAAVQGELRRGDPMRRRVQRAGIILMVLGGFFLASAGSILLPGRLEEGQVALLASQPGGDLVVESAIPGNVTVRDMEGAVLAETVLQNGTARFDDLERGVVNVTLVAADGNHSRHVGSARGETARVTYAADDSPGLASGVQFSRTQETVARIGLGVGLAVALAITVAGVCAFRLRYRAIALTGAVLGAIVALMSVFTLLLLGLLFALPLAYAVVALVRGRAAFR